MRPDLTRLASFCAAVLLLACPAWPQLDGIDRVKVTPAAPSPAEPITVEGSGTMPSGPVTVLGSNFAANGNQLTLDIDVRLGALTVLTDWSFQHDIGTLPPGEYDLTLRALAGGNLAGIEQIRFAVVPEPTGIAALALGGFLLLRCR